MDINATLIGQMITFAVFVWFTMKFVWPHLMTIMEDRRNKIADGLAAAEQGHKTLAESEEKSRRLLIEAKGQAAKIIEQANQRAAHIIEEAKIKGREEGEHLLVVAKSDIAREYSSARQQLLNQISSIAVAGAEKILNREIDQASNDKLIDELVKEI